MIRRYGLIASVAVTFVFSTAARGEVEVSLGSNFRNIVTGSDHRCGGTEFQTFDVQSFTGPLDATTSVVQFSESFGTGSASSTMALSDTNQGALRTITWSFAAQGTVALTSQDSGATIGASSTGGMGASFEVLGEPIRYEINFPTGPPSPLVTLFSSSSGLLGVVCPANVCGSAVDTLARSGTLAPGLYSLAVQVSDGAHVQNCPGGLGLGPQYQSAFNFTLTFDVPRRPVLIIPGIGATYAADPSNDLFWLTHRGVNPGELQIDPLTRAYHDLIQTLKNVGYREFKDLWVVNYDWRLPPGPDDAVIDGQIGGLTAASISDQSYEYAVDYLGDVLKQAAEQWAQDHPNEPPLDAVEVIAHSTGGLVARTYVQSAAYGGAYASGKNLPRINNLIMIGVPNRGASKAWNPLHNNWKVDPAFALVLSKIVNRALQKVARGKVISGPDYDIPPGPCRDASTPEICFIDLYVPTARALLATYDFIDFGSGVTNVNSDLVARNSLVLDLNCGLDRVNVCPDPNAFANDANVTIIYGTNGGDTPTRVVEKQGPFPDLPFRPGLPPIWELDDFLPRAAASETYYDDIKLPDAGDGTVPLESSIGQFLFDSRVILEPFTQGVNTQQSVAHVALMFNPDVQKTILNTLKVPFDDPGDISTTLHGNQPSAIACAVNGCLNVIFDPVEGFVVDARGRRLGFSTATGPVTEIPGSVWFGNADGIGWIFSPAEEPLALPLTLELTGLGEDYYVAVTVLSSAGDGGLVDEGFLPQGQRKDLPVPIGTGDQPPADTTPPVVTVPADQVAQATSALGAAVSYPLATATDDVGVASGPTCSPASGSTFPLGTTVVTCTASDAAGNVGSASFTVTVRYAFTGFFQPVANLPAANQVSAGRAIPLKFSLAGNQGLGIFAPGSPVSVAIGCGTGSPVDVPEETVTPGSSSLTYDPGSDQYHYVWKTSGAWANSCRQLILRLSDGTDHRANFGFK